MPLTIATWNINSVRLRIGIVEQFLKAAQPDVLCLQETKTVDETFPRAAFEAMGYPHQAISGQKNHHGVAIVSRLPLDRSEKRGWCGKTDARHMCTVLPGDIMLDNFYVPAGGDEPDPEVNPKFAHKLAFLAEMADWSAEVRALGGRRIVVGDLNVAPLETDVWSHKQLLKVVSHTPVEVEAMGRIMAAGAWVDAIRHFRPEPEKVYTWWSYRAPDWAKADKGRRLDHVWVSPDLKPALAGHAIHRDARGWLQPSDHVPVTVTLDL
ncbi:exodeoxyribonuclease III [Zavarzinia sp. CC-PAN008]|uniref:exodeoxyribonuclease III n=1 Tax=Zavarzinia sp. CC-PAN008 TaxID=3243332 RepID=UPI003F7421FF